MKDKIKIKIDEEEFIAEKRTFSSGKEGYGVYGRMGIDGEAYQISCNIINLKKKFERR